MNAARTEGSARERLLAAANELFYAEGVHTVGIDRIIAQAGVAKASLYSAFGSKDELVRAYVQARAERRKVRITDWLARYATPREKLLGLFDLLEEQASEPTFRGCAFVNANAEGPRDDLVVEVTRASRAWVRELMAALAAEDHVQDPEQLAGQVAVLYDGALIGAAMEGDGAAITHARALAASLVAAAARSKRTRKR